MEGWLYGCVVSWCRASRPVSGERGFGKSVSDVWMAAVAAAAGCQRCWRSKGRREPGRVQPRGGARRHLMEEKGAIL